MGVPGLVVSQAVSGSNIALRPNRPARAPHDWGQARTAHNWPHGPWAPPTQQRHTGLRAGFPPKVLVTGILIR